jgi:amino acid transporter
MRRSPALILIGALAVPFLLVLTAAGLVQISLMLLIAGMAVAVAGFLLTVAIDWLISRLAKRAPVRRSKLFFRWVLAVGCLLVLFGLGVFVAPPPDLQLKALFASNAFVASLGVFFDFALPGFILVLIGLLGLRFVDLPPESENSPSRLSP